MFSKKWPVVVVKFDVPTPSLNMNIETFGKDTRTSFYTGNYLRMILFTCKRRMEPSSEGNERLPATTCTSGFAAALPKSPRLPFRSERKIHKY